MYVFFFVKVLDVSILYSFKLFYWGVVYNIGIFMEGIGLWVGRIFISKYV